MPSGSFFDASWRRAPPVHTVATAGESSTPGAYLAMVERKSRSAGRSVAMWGKTPSGATSPSRFGSLATDSMTARLAVMYCGL